MSTQVNFVSSTSVDFSNEVYYYREQVISLIESLEINTCSVQDSSISSSPIENRERNTPTETNEEERELFRELDQLLMQVYQLMVEEG